MTIIDDILADVTKALRPALEAALVHVKEDAKREAAAEFKSKLAAMLDDTPQAVIAQKSGVAPKDDRVVYSPPHRKTRKGRASPGTVKPQILSVIRNSPDGVGTKEIAEKTGFKYNSVRGTLWLLKKELAIENRDERWFATVSDIINQSMQSSEPAPARAGTE